MVSSTYFFVVSAFMGWPCAALRMIRTRTQRAMTGSKQGQGFTFQDNRSRWKWGVLGAAWRDGCGFDIFCGWKVQQNYEWSALKTCGNVSAAVRAVPDRCRRTRTLTATNWLSISSHFEGCSHKSGTTQAVRYRCMSAGTHFMQR